MTSSIVVVIRRSKTDACITIGFQDTKPGPSASQSGHTVRPEVTAVISKRADNMTMHKKGATYTLRTRVPPITTSHHDEGRPAILVKFLPTGSKASSAPFSSRNSVADDPVP